MWKCDCLLNRNPICSATLGLFYFYTLVKRDSFFGQSSSECFTFGLHFLQVYSNAHKHMHEGVECDGEKFPGGIVNGAEWYDVSGRPNGLIYQIRWNRKIIYQCLR